MRKGCRVTKVTKSPLGRLGRGPRIIFGLSHHTGSDDHSKGQPTTFKRGTDWGDPANRWMNDVTLPLVCSTGLPVLLLIKKKKKKSLEESLFGLIFMCQMSNLGLGWGDGGGWTRPCQSKGG